MDKEIRFKAQLAHDTASARYALALDSDYQVAVDGRPPSYVQAFRSMALALLGSPFCRVTHRKWGKEAKSWLLSLN